MLSCFAFVKKQVDIVEYEAHCYLLTKQVSHHDFTKSWELEFFIAPSYSTKANKVVH